MAQKNGSGRIFGGRLLGAGALVLAVAGCAHIREAGREIWGSSIAHLERARRDARTLDVTMDRKAAFAAVEKILGESGANVYLKDREGAYLAAMGFAGHVDTTEVGVFFVSTTAHVTRLEVASMSPSLADRVARLLFEKLHTETAAPEPA
ncbi:MAG: hypothetical protein ACM3L6_02535 [Deltaproteobacteria bacterium]